MTTIAFRRDQAGLLEGFDASGHSGWGEAGGDIVCAAVTSAVRLAECILNDAMGLAAETAADGAAASISLRLPAERRSEGREVLGGLLLYLRQLEREYPGYIRVRED